MKVNELGSIAVAVIVLAGLAVTLKNGGQAAQVLNAGGSAFANIIKAAAYGT